MFDVTGYFQTEIERSAHRLMHEVAEIASVYHWSERDILAMAPARRRFYLQELLHNDNGIPAQYRS